MRESSLNVYRDMKWLPLHLRRQLHTATYMYKIINDIAPSNIINKFKYVSGGSREGSNCNLYINKSRSHKEFFYLGAKCWNTLNKNQRSATNAKIFSSIYKSQLLRSILSDNNYIPNNAIDYFYTTQLDKCDG